MQQSDPDKRKNPWSVTGWSLLLVGGLAAWLALLWSGPDTARAWRALLINFLYFTPLASGLVTWSAIVIAANGRWTDNRTEHITWTGIGFLGPSLLILFVLWIGSPAWAPWYGRTFHQGVWLNNSFLFLRVLAGLLIFSGTAVWFLRKRTRGRQRSVAPAAVLIVIFCIIFTLFAFDLVAALTPEWRSALFGAYFFISTLYLAVVFWTLLAVLDGRTAVHVRQDLGKLILAFSILTTSFVFMQLLTIWYENLPEETSFLIDRLHQKDWMIVSYGLLVIVYFGPLLLLVPEWAKKNRMYLGAVSIVLLIGLWTERWWLVAPSFSPVARFGFVELAATTAAAGIFGLSIAVGRRYLPEATEEKENAE